MLLRKAQVSAYSSINSVLTTILDSILRQYWHNPSLERVQRCVLIFSVVCSYIPSLFASMCVWRFNSTHTSSKIGVEPKQPFPFVSQAFFFLLLLCMCLWSSINVVQTFVTLWKLSAEFFFSEKGAKKKRKKKQGIIEKAFCGEYCLTAPSKTNFLYGLLRASGSFPLKLFRLSKMRQLFNVPWEIVLLKNLRELLCYVFFTPTILVWEFLRCVGRNWM